MALCDNGDIGLCRVACVVFSWRMKLSLYTALPPLQKMFIKPKRLIEENKKFSFLGWGCLNASRGSFVDKAYSLDCPLRYLWGRVRWLCGRVSDGK